MDNKTAIITGSNVGIGKETALEFYKRGAKVIMACRNIEKAERAAADIVKQTEGLSNTGQLTVRQLDLSSFESIRKCAQDITRDEPAIHLLVNNAGVMAVPKEISVDGFEMHFAVNYLGHFLFTLLLLPRIIRSAPARIVNVASSAHMFGDGKMHYEDINLEHGYKPMKAYGRSKLANIMFSNELGRRLKGTGVTTYSLHPGVVQTELFRNITETMPMLSRLCRTFGSFFFKTPVQGCQTILHCSLDEKCANETGLYYSECCISTPFARARDERKSEELWNASLQYVQLASDYNPFIAQ